ncbi:MAG: acyl-CoA thioesterase [Phycisphaerales bacterium]
MGTRRNEDRRTPEAWSEVAVERLASLAGAREGVGHPRPRLFRRSVGDGDVIAPYDHVSNVVLGRWLDEIAATTFDRDGTLAAGLAWFIGRHEIEFLAETMRGDTLVAATWVGRVERLRAWRETVFFREHDGAALVRSSATWILVDFPSRRPRRIPAPMIAALDVLDPPDAPRSPTPA